MKENEIIKSVKKRGRPPKRKSLKNYQKNCEKPSKSSSLVTKLPKSSCKAKFNSKSVCKQLTSESKTFPSLKPTISKCLKSRTLSEEELDPNIKTKKRKRGRPRKKRELKEQEKAIVNPNRTRNDEEVKQDILQNPVANNSINSQILVEAFNPFLVSLGKIGDSLEKATLLSLQICSILKETIPKVQNCSCQKPVEPQQLKAQPTEESCPIEFSEKEQAESQEESQMNLQVADPTPMLECDGIKELSSVVKSNFGKIRRLAKKTT
ncbi:unnamed protein product [Moneuplotes crassus]|uniref:Uncharacterized protein n=1 Tax=Euplotes crassus TaxID=5936 RepID=A0AAD1XJ55_EUPCR|nr:unnamed protein product [Moneuplotes crassus]